MTDTTTQTESKEFNLAEMSDEDISNFDSSRLEGAIDPGVDTPEDQSAVETKVSDTTDEETDGAVLSDTSQTEDDEVADSTSTDVHTDAGTDQSAKVSEQQETVPDTDQVTEQTDTDSKTTEEATSKVNYKEEFAKIMAPFKAAKREIKIDNISDARRLMQMGVDYSRKMEAMKPYQRVLKTLEKNNLLDIGRLNFLIDLDKKNPEAIKKFLKDSEIDPMDLSLEDDTNVYKPTDHMIGEQELALDDVLDDIRKTDTFDRTAQVISKEWDTASRRVLFEDPQIIRTLNDHMQSGIFDKIAEVMERERILGRLVGLSDLEAYKTVGDALQAGNAFQPPPPIETSSNGNTPQLSQGSGSGSAKADELRNRRLAASPPKGAASAGKSKVDLSKLSDEDIEKMDYTTL